MSKSMSLHPAGGRSGPAWAPLAARGLGAASRLLGRLAARLAAVGAPGFERPLPPMLEFYADASAPEGALYLNGELVGKLPGVTRL